MVHENHSGSGRVDTVALGLGTMAAFVFIFNIGLHTALFFGIDRFTNTALLFGMDRFTHVSTVLRADVPLLVSGIRTVSVMTATTSLL